MPKQKIILFIGVALALAAVFMAKVYLDQQRQALKEQAKEDAAASIQEQSVAVLTAKQDIPRGTTVDASMVQTANVPEQFLQPQAVNSLERLSGMISIANIARGEQLTLTKFIYPKQSGGLSELTPVGKRAITISVDNTSALLGMLKPGDYVDIISMIPQSVQGPDGKPIVQVISVPVFQNVLVLAVGQETGSGIKQDASRYKKEEGSSVSQISPFITIALTAQEATLVAFLQEQGKFRLILRSNADSKIEQVRPASWDTLFQYLNLGAAKEPAMPEHAQAPEIKKEEPKPTGYVEIYKGLTKEKVPLYNNK